MAEGENRKSFPMLPISHWWTLRKKFRQSIPGIVTDSYLATVLNMEANSARANVFPFLKVLGITDQEGKPTQRAKLWRDDQHYGEVCKAMLQDVYPAELLEAVPDPVSEKEKAKSWFARKTSVGEAGANRMVALYSVLVEADASKQPDQEKKRTPKKASTQTAVSAQKIGGQKPTSATPISQSDYTSGEADSDKRRRNPPEQGPEVNINLQIHISADASSDQIDQIFASMSKHIYKRD